PLWWQHCVWDNGGSTSRWDPRLCNRRGWWSPSRWRKHHGYQCRSHRTWKNAGSCYISWGKIHPGRWPDPGVS
ncbi:hypothetical protein GDO78_013610, partial [Eleutherodactylus coqui]